MNTMTNWDAGEPLNAGTGDRSFSSLPGAQFPGSQGPQFPGASASRTSRLENAAFVSMLAFAAATQFSIAVAQSLLTLAAALGIILVIRDRERVEVPRMFWPLVIYAAVTLVAAAFSIAPDVSWWDTKQLLLFVVVPLAYRLFRGGRSFMAIDVVITVGALHAAYGIVQYGVLNYDNLGRRVQGLLGLYMTYSGLIMLVACTVVARCRGCSACT